MNILTLLSKYLDLSSLDAYEEAIVFSIDRYSYLINSHGLLYFPFGPFINAKKCVVALTENDDFSIKKLEKDILTYSPKEDYLKERHGMDIYDSTLKAKYLLSVATSSLIIEEGDYRFVLFPDQVKGNKTTVLCEQLAEVYTALSDFAGVTTDISLPWHILDDEKFESLCYDIIYHQFKFDNRTIRKMGKSRSRDGGRDIVVYTKERPGKPSKMYIFQCKFTKTGTSLTTQKIENISDTIIQYRAQGYGIMTSVVIDAALYDRVDAICQTLNIESDHWSVFEIERFLARNPKLRERHFKGD